MNTCDTCKFWTPMGKNWSPTKFMHTCENGKLEEAWDENNQDEDSLMYSYTEGGSFHPGPKFGCVHHQPKCT